MKRRMGCLMVLMILVYMSVIPTQAYAKPYNLESRASTPILEQTRAMYNNLDIAIDLVDGTRVPYGKPFSFLDVTGPKGTAQGYMTALNGRGVYVVGGGISQVAATLYLALREEGNDGIEIIEKHVFSKFTGGYVDDRDDAIAVDYDDGLDLRFKNWSEDFTIYMWRDEETIFCWLSTDEGGDESENIPQFDYAAKPAKLNQVMATRTGPNTEYTEGKSFPQDTGISVFYQAEGNGVMWGLVEFQYGGEWYRLYTGMKRIDTSKNVPLESEPLACFAEVLETVRLRYGPGVEYAVQEERIPRNTEVRIRFQENAYVMVDYVLGDHEVVRGWIPMDVLSYEEEARE